MRLNDLPYMFNSLMMDSFFFGFWQYTANTKNRSLVFFNKAYKKCSSTTIYQSFCLLLDIVYSVFDCSSSIFIYFYILPVFILKCRVSRSAPNLTCGSTSAVATDALKVEPSRHLEIPRQASLQNRNRQRNIMTLPLPLSLK